MGGAIHCEQGHAQWLVLPCRCTGTKEGWPGQTRIRNQATLECSSALTLLLLRGRNVCISVYHKWNFGNPSLDSGTASSLCMCFLLLFCPYRSCVGLLWTSSQNSSNVCCVVDLVTRLTNTKMVVKSRGWGIWETWKRTRGLGLKPIRHMSFTNPCYFFFVYVRWF